MKLLSCAINICLLLTTYSYSLVPAQQAEKVWDPWLIRAQMITESLVKDATALASPDRALLWARLGVAWLKDDPDRAHAWMQKAVEEIEVTSDQESADDRRRRLATARSLLRIIAPQDKQLGLRLTDVFTPQAEVATDSGRRDNASALVDSALSIIDRDPQRAAKLGSASLHIGLTYRLASLLWELRKRDTKLADSLFDQILTVAGAAYDQESLGWLAVYAFRGQTSDERRARLLAILAEALLRTSPSAGDEEKACGFAPTAAPLLEQFNRLLPQQAAMVRVAITKCQPSLNPYVRKPVDEALRDRPLKTVDDLVKEADKASNQHTRDDYLTQAAQMAAQKKEFERATALLDLISDEGRKQSNGGWEGLRWNFASSAAVTLLKRGDRYRMNQIISATPSPLRPFVQLTVAQELANSVDHTDAIEFLKEARKGMVLSYPPYRVSGYMDLMRQYAKLDPVDALNVLTEAVKAINSAEQSGQQSSEYPDMYDRVNALSNDLLLGLFNLPVSLFEIDDLRVEGAVSSIESPMKRAAVGLNLLNGSLEQHRAATSSTKK